MYRYRIRGETVKRQNASHHYGYCLKTVSPDSIGSAVILLPFIDPVIIPSVKDLKTRPICRNTMAANQTL